MECAEKVTPEANSVDDVPLIVGHLPKLFSHVRDDCVDASVCIVDLRIVK